MPRKPLARHDLARATALAAFAMLASTAHLEADDSSLQQVGCVTLPDFEDEDQAENLSGAALSDDGALLVIATDEGSELLVVSASGTELELLEPIGLELGDSDDKAEIDLEGVTRHGERSVFVAVGSHSWRRRNIGGRHANKTYSDLKERFEEESPDPEPDRDRLVRVELDPETGALIGTPRDLLLDPAGHDLREVLDEHPVLRHFDSIPSKENGIDIEGVASDGEMLYLGFRGPVLRSGLVPILVVSPEGAVEPELRYVPLGGRGVRDIARVSDGFLIVAGPVGDSPLSYQLYFWDGSDAFPGVREPSDPPRGEIALLGTIPTPEDGKAEALVVLAEEGPAWVTEHKGAWVLLILYDGPAGGSPGCFRVTRPA